MAQKGEADAALELLAQGSQDFQELGDLDGRASTLWAMAQIELDRGKHSKMVPMIEEAYRIVDRLGRLEGICAIGYTLGQILVGAGRREEGLAVLRRSEAGFRQMNRGSEADMVASLILNLNEATK